METEPFLRHRLIEELHSEYYRSLTSSITELDPEITWPDIHVWFHKLNHQNVLDEIKKIWDHVPASKLGRKTLYRLFSKVFCEVYVDRLLHRHTSFKWLNSEILMLTRLLDGCKSQLQTVCLRNPGLQAYSESPIVRPQSSSSGKMSTANSEDTLGREEGKEDGEMIGVAVTVHKAQIVDLGSAFAEGFLGYSVDVQIGDENEETSVVDIHGNSAEWGSTFK